MKIWWVLAGVIFALLAAREAGAGGACTAARFHTWQDAGCDPTYPGAGGTKATQSCACQNQPPAHGMPQWWVSEPYISLCLADTPLSYSLSSGKEMAFTFHYNQRVSLPGPDESFITNSDITPTGPQYQRGANCGADAFWGCNWNMSVVIKALGTKVTPAFSTGYCAMVFHPEGNVDLYTNWPGGAPQNPQTQVVFTDNSGGLGYPKVYEYYPLGGYSTNAPTADANGIYWGDTNVGVKLAYPDGRQEIFALSADYVLAKFPLTPVFTTDASNPVVRLMLTQRIDAEGRVTKLGYEYYHDPIYTWQYRVRYVVDPDARTNTFLYAATTNNQLAEIDDPYGRRTTLGYNSDGTLKQLVDAAGLTTSFQYPASQTTVTANYASANNDLVQSFTYTTVSSSGWISQMVTPYGTNSFCYYEMDDDTVTNGVQQRAIYASEPEGAQQLYYYLHKASGLVTNTDTAPYVPGLTNFDDGIAGGISGHNALYYRNTFHWGRRQFTALAGNSGFMNNLANALVLQSSQPGNSAIDFGSALAALGAADFSKADMKHWLWQADNISISSSVSSERAPSFDVAGQSLGLRTWYNYAGKPAGGAEDIGGNPQIACVAKVLPDATSQYTTYHFYPPLRAGAGLVSDNETTYTKPDGNIGLLTNWFTYAGNSVDLLSVSNSAGQYVNYGYNGSHQVTALTNALQQVTTYSWNPNLTGIQLPSGQSLSLGYYYAATPPTATSSLLQWQILQPEGRCFTNNSYYAGLPASITDDRGVTLQNTWDGLNRLTSTVFPDNTSVSNIYNRLDLVAAKDRLTNWTYYAYDGLQHLINVTNANNAATAYKWCGCGSLSEIIDPQNGVNDPTSLNYDNQGNLLNVTLPDGSSRNWQYDLVGRMTNFVDGSGLRFLQVAYNNQGLPVTVTSANGILQSAVYDALNRPISLTDANGVTVTNTYDSINELVKRTWPDGNGEGFGYATNGLVAYTNRDGQATFYGRDGAGRLTAETNANHEVTQYAYDSLDHITRLVDGLNHAISWQYNQYGWLTNKLDGLNRTNACFAYNADGWVTNRWTPEKGSTAYTYDGVGNLKSILYPQLSIFYAYDGLNRRTNMVDAAGNHAFTWTAASQLASESDAWATNSWGYSQGLRTVMTNVQAGGNWVQTYSYDDGWRLQTLTSPAGSFGYGYSFAAASPLVTGISLPNGANIVNGYDSLARLHQTALNNYWGHALDSETYTPDALGLRTNLVRNLGLSSSTVNVGFDAIGQLTSWSAAESGGVLRQNEQLAYGFDAAHNLHTRTNGALGQTFTTDAANQLNTVARTGTLTLSGATPAPATTLTVNGEAAQLNGDFTYAAANLALANGANSFTNVGQNLHGVLTTNLLTMNLPVSVTLAYDNNGNLTNDGARSFGYDAENQLTNVYVPGQWRSDFVYDGLNRRRIELDYLWQNGAWAVTNETLFVYDGYELLQERNTNGKVLVTYTRGGDFSGSLQGAGGIGGLLARTDTNGSTFYHADGAGNITALMDGEENIAARYLYNPFGKLLGQWGPLAAANEMQFSSMPRHNASGLSLYAFRLYDPNLQRWLSEDPAGERGGINLYGFVENSPVNLYDPFGLSDDDDEWGIGNARLQIAATGSGLFADLAYDRETKARHDQIMCEGMRALKNGAKELAKQVAIQAAVLVATDGLGNLARLATIAKDAGEVADATAAAEDGIIYLRTDSQGAEYVGQALNDARYAARQAEHAAANPTEAYTFQELERVPANSGRSLNVAEEDWIRAGGGPQSTGGTLQNARHQMSDFNYRQAGGTISYP